MNDSNDQSDRTSRRAVGERVLAIFLLACIVIVGAWEILANWSHRPFDPFQVRGDDFAGFQPGGDGWSAKLLVLQQSRYEANIMAYLFQREKPVGGSVWAGAVQIRLVHGFNMPDCMRIKHYTVELVRDARSGRAEDWGGRRVQIWRLTAPSGERSIWATSMLRTGDLAETDVDICDMAYPRVGVPDDPGWVPRGVDREFLKHPIRDFRRLVRTKWNNANCDWAVFLKFKQRAWASDELLTLIGSTEGTRVEPDREDAAIAEVVAAQSVFLDRLIKWRRQKPVGEEGSKGGGIP